MHLHNDTRPIKQIDKDNLEANRIFIQYPIPKICNLRCPYCFHSDYFNGRPDTVKYADIIGFTTEQFRIWMETHIYSNFNEIVIHFAGGEPFFSSNTQMISSIANYIPHQVKFDFLTNGLFNDLGSCVLEQIIRRIHRVGCTYHRDTLTFKQAALFHNNVKILRDLGIPVYVKELLHKNHLLDILKHRNYWRDQGIDFKIQDIQSADASPQGYNAKDLALIADEYKHQGHYCSCWQGWKSISIRGYDIAAGNVVACWLDPKIIGNVADNTLNLNFRVEIDDNLARRNVTGGDFQYSNKGTFDRDRKIC